MNPSSTDYGVIMALMERFEKQRLPRLIALRQKTEKCEPLSDLDLEFLEMVIREARQNRVLIDRHPELQPFCANVIQLYEIITGQALENEKTS